MGVYSEMLDRIWGSYEGLTAYEMMMKVNYNLVTDTRITSREQGVVLDHLLSCVNSYDSWIDGFEKNPMKPVFFMPDRKEMYKTVTTVTPKTKLLSENSYELEILRVLALYAHSNYKVRKMLEVTKERLRKSCFGNGCSKGECFDLSIIVLRFLATAYPDDITWMNELIGSIKVHMEEKPRHSGVLLYYWLTLSELPIEVAKPEIERYSTKATMQDEFHSLPYMLKKSYVMRNKQDRYATPFGMYVMRNCLSRLNEYKHLQRMIPYISKEDGKLRLIS